MKPLRDIEYKDGVIYACAGQSSHPITRKYFMDRSGIRRKKTINMIAKDWHIHFADEHR